MQSYKSSTSTAAATAIQGVIPEGEGVIQEVPVGGMDMGVVIKFLQNHPTFSTYLPNPNQPTIFIIYQLRVLPTTTETLSFTKNQGI